MAKLKVIKQLVSDTPNKFGRNNKKRYITVHLTDNWNIGANAQTHANLQSNGNSRAANWHWQVDDKVAIQSFTHDFQLWQSGDGGGDGNMNSISIEGCVNADGNYKKMLKNLSKLVNKIMKDEGITIMRVVQHNHWSGKNCPSDIRAGRDGVSWKDLINMIQGAKVTVKVKKPSKKTASKQYKGNSIVDYLNATGNDSSFDNRAKLAKANGIKGYTGTEAQNLKLLKLLKKGAPKTVKKAAGIKVGNKVTLRPSAKNYVGASKGVKIPSGVKGKEYTVMQIKGSSVLLKEIMSWVRKADVSTSAVTKKAATKKKASSGGKYGYLQIVNVNSAAIMMDKPDRIKGKNIDSIPKGTKVALQGSVKGKNNPGGYWEVKYNGKLGYVTAKYGKRV